MTATTPAKTPSPPLPQRQGHRATWADYVALRDAPNTERLQLAFNEAWLWSAMGAEGISHATMSDLFTIFFGFWAMQHPEQVFSSLGRCPSLC